MRAIASVNTGATDSTLMLSSFFSLVSGMVSRMVSSLIGLSLMRSIAGPDRTPWLAHA